MSNLDERSVRARVSLDGLSVGDAFGERLFVVKHIDDSLIAKRDVPDKLPWRWTDDTAMALSVVQCLEEIGTINEDYLMSLFSSRFSAEPDRGYGFGARELLQSVLTGGDWRQLSVAMFRGGSFGNGAAMRVAPLGVWFSDDMDQVVEMARLSARPTHAHVEGQAGGIAVALAAASIWRSRSFPIDEARSLLWSEVIDRTPVDTEVSRKLISIRDVVGTPEAIADMYGSGQQVSAQDTVPFVIWSAANGLHDFRDAMWNTARGLGDIDTTCAMVGGIISSRTGVPHDLLALREPLPDLVTM